MTYLTVTETAEKLDISRQAVLKLIRRGTLPATAEARAGRVTRYFVPASVVAERAAGSIIPDGWVTVNDAAALRGTSPDAIRNWVQNCGLAADTLPDGRLVIDRAVLDGFPTPRSGPRRVNP